MRETALQDWINKKPEDKNSYPVTESIAFAIDRFFFKHYCQSFRRGAFARANSSMWAILSPVKSCLLNPLASPMINMCGMLQLPIFLPCVNGILSDDHGEYFVSLPKSLTQKMLVIHYQTW
jgi:hypothetical protein